jgi:hypothetical protein
LKVDPALQSETLRSFRVVAFGLPILVSVTGLVGTLEAFQKFKLVNAIRIPTGIYTFVGPLLVLPYSSRLSSTVVLALLFGRLVEWLIFFLACLNTIPGVLKPGGARTAPDGGPVPLRQLDDRHQHDFAPADARGPLPDRGGTRGQRSRLFRHPRGNRGQAAHPAAGLGGRVVPLFRGQLPTAPRRNRRPLRCAPAAICCSACFPWLLWWWRWLPSFSPCGWMPDFGRLQRAGHEAAGYRASFCTAWPMCPCPCSRPRDGPT